MKKILLLFVFVSLSTMTILAQNINEIHYDNASTDVGEFVEVFIPDPQPADLSMYQIELINQSGSVYDTYTLDGATATAGMGGTYYVVATPGIQNGGSDGLALCGPGGALIEVLSYEGTTTAGSGCAMGILSTNIGVSETSSTPAGTSIQLQSDGSWVAGLTETPGGENVAPLPVELTSFTAVGNSKEVSLNWITATELNNSHFDIEYSTDGSNFRAIDEVAGNGTTQLKQEYSYTHTTPAFGLNYYRLKQVDFDGAFEYSDISVVEIKRTGKIVINPSAAIAEITVQLADVAGENNLIGIYDMMGRTVSMSNFDGTLNTKTIDISNLQKGYYVVRVQAGSEVFTERFMKMVD